MDTAENEMDKIEARLSPSDQRRYKLPLPPLLRFTERVADFSPECEICRGLHSQIASLGADLTVTPRMTRRNLKGHLKVIKGTTKHLKRTHGLSEERHYLKRFAFGSLTVGLSLIALTLILLSLGITLIALNVSVIALVPRVIFSCTIGYLLDRRARKLGKVL